MLRVNTNKYELNVESLPSEKSLLSSENISNKTCRYSLQGAILS